MDSFFKKISGKSKIAKELLTVATNNAEWEDDHKFLVKLIPDELINRDPFLLWLRKIYVFTCYIIKLDGYQNYDWHTDARRGVSINMLLQDVESFVMFTNDTESPKNITLLRYQPKSYYVFNTQAFHSVINLEGTRFIFSILFEKDKYQLTYNDVLKTINEYKSTEEEK